MAQNDKKAVPRKRAVHDSSKPELVVIEKTPSEGVFEVIVKGDTSNKETKTVVLTSPRGVALSEPG